jgi:hypothetical protein
MAETKYSTNDKINNIIDKLYKNSNNKRNEKNALGGKETLKKKILSKEHALVTLGLYRTLSEIEKACVNGKNSDKDVKDGILKQIYNLIVRIEKGEEIKDVYINYTQVGKNILEEYLSGNNNRGKSDSKQKKTLAFSKLFLNQERQKCGKR